MGVRCRRHRFARETCNTNIKMATAEIPSIRFHLPRSKGWILKASVKIKPFWHCSKVILFPMIRRRETA